MIPKSDKKIYNKNYRLIVFLNIDTKILLLFERDWS